MKLIMFYAILLLCSIAYTASANNFPCVWTAPSGKKYDFTKANDLEVSADDSWFYSFSFCGQTKNKMCRDSGGVGCILEDVGQSEKQFSYVTARWDSHQNQPENIKEGKDGVLTINFNNGDRFSRDLTAQLEVTAKCGKTESIKFISALLPSISISVVSPAACPLDDDGLSGGAIFLIIVLVSFAVYFIVGFLVCKFYFKQSTIKDSIPNVQFWTALPGFYFAGLKLTFRTIQSAITGKKATSVSSSDYSSYGTAEEV